MTDGDENGDDTYAGVCALCGALSRFSCADPIRARSSYRCEHCGATLCERGIAQVLLDLYDHAHASLTGAVAYGGLAHLRVMEAGTGRELGGLLRTLRRSLGVRRDEVAGWENFGSTLQRRALASGSLDVVVTQDVLDQASDAPLALREIKRALRFGGTHVFTTPALANVSMDDSRVDPADELTSEGCRTCLVSELARSGMRTTIHYADAANARRRQAVVLASRKAG